MSPGNFCNVSVFACIIQYICSRLYFCMFCVSPDPGPLHITVLSGHLTMLVGFFKGSRSEAQEECS